VRERDLDAGSLLAVVVECLKAVHETDTALVVNDRIDVALAARAAGVHLRADSVAPERARALVGPAMLIGRSVHSVAEAQLVAEAGGVDYLVFGTVFPSASKGPRHEALGIDRLLQVVQAVTLPVLAIGGVGLEQVADIGATGAAGVAGIGYFQTGTPAELASRVAALRQSFDMARPRSLP
jgi:thiamine-phosphate diphosphorylase